MDQRPNPTDNIWTSYAEVACRSTPTLALVSSRSLPEQHLPSAIVADAAASMSMWISDDDFHIKGLRRARKKTSWCEAWSHHGYATVVAFLVCITQNRKVLTGANATHLVERLNAITPELGTLIPHPDDATLPDQIDMSWVTARSARLLDDTATRFGLSFRGGHPFHLIAAITLGLKGSMAAAQHAFDLARWQDPGTPDKTRGFVDQLADLSEPAPRSPIRDQQPDGQSTPDQASHTRSGFPPPQAQPNRRTPP